MNEYDSMSGNLRLVFGAEYDRVRPLMDREFADKFGLSLDVEIADGPPNAFRMLANDLSVTGGEMSLSFYTMLVSKMGSSSPFIALPAFVSRMFRHGNILVSDAAGIRKPSDLRGKRVGVYEYGSTMAVWARGILEEYYGVHSGDVEWYEAREPIFWPDVDVQPSASVRVSGSPVGDLTAAMMDGRLDACIGLVPRPMPRGVSRLFADYHEVERAYYVETGIFPMMHIVALRRDFAEGSPDVVRRLYLALVAAKDLAIERLQSSASPAVTLPWVLSSFENQSDLMGGDVWPYGVIANRAALEKFLAYADSQGLLADLLSPDDFFFSGL